MHIVVRDVVVANTFSHVVDRKCTVAYSFVHHDVGNHAVACSFVNIAFGNGAATNSFAKETFHDVVLACSSVAIAFVLLLCLMVSCVVRWLARSGWD